jgi:hypothetical protein
MVGPVLDLLDRALDLAAADGDRAADLSDQDPAQALLVPLQRLGQLRQAVIAKIEVT